MSGRFSRRGLLAVLAGGAAMGVVEKSRAAPAAADEAPPAGQSIAERLAAYAAALRYADIDAGTIETTKAHVIDAIGCAVSAFDEGPVRICRDVALATKDGPSTVLGTTRRTSPELAAFANGVAMRYFDMNDVYAGREPGHPSDNITPVLAVAEAEGATGEDLLTAIVLAYEIDCRLLDGAEVTERGFDHPVYSLPAAALSAGKLMRLAPEKLTQAVNLAINGHIALNQTRVQQLSDWKGVADAESARNAVFAAELARGGLTGPAPIFEGRAGFFKQVSGPFTIDVEGFGGRGGAFKINDCGIKLYAAQGYSATAIPAAAAIAKEAGDLSAIKAIEIATTRMGYVTAGRDKEKWAPKTRETADHSLPYIVTRAMLDGDITNTSYSPEKLNDPKLRELIAKITVKEDPALTALMPKALPNRVTATLADGRVLSRQVDDLPGFPGRAMQRSDIEEKFRKNVSVRFGEAQAQRVLGTLWQLERQVHIGELMGLMVAKG